MQERQNTNRKKGVTSFIRIAVLCFAFYFVVVFLQVRDEIAKQREYLTKLDMMIEEQTVINDALRDQIDNGVTDEYIASVARDKLGYALPGERIFVDSSSK